jgi:hypothetical protein
MYCHGPALEVIAHDQSAKQRLANSVKGALPRTIAEMIAIYLSFRKINQALRR